MIEGNTQTSSFAVVHKVMNKDLTSHSDVLQLGHELAVKAAHCVSCEEPCPSLSKVIIDFAEVVHQDVLRVVIALKKHKLEFLEINVKSVSQNKKLK